MRKRLISLLLCALTLISLLALPAFARYEVVKRYTRDLSFSGSTAYCSVYVEAVEDDAEITATIKLQKKGLLGIYTTEEKWSNVTATGELDFYRTYSPISSGDYRLTADIDVVGDGGSDSFTLTATATR